VFISWLTEDVRFMGREHEVRGQSISSRPITYLSPSPRHSHFACSREQEQ
jgi:hypothetical protein